MSITLAGQKYNVKRAQAAVDRADKFLSKYPGSSTAGIVRDLRDTISDMEKALIRCINSMPQE